MTLAQTHGTARQRKVSVRGGKIEANVFEAGWGGPALVYLHGLSGLAGLDPWLEQLADTYHVIAPQHPGSGESTGLEAVDDILNLAIYYLDLLDALGVERAHLVGHSFGGMVAAEIAAIDRGYVDKLVLVDAFGLWLDEHPVRDIFAMTAPELDRLLWHDPDGEAAQRNKLTPDMTEAELLRRTVERVKTMATVGKFTWAVPDRGLKDRIHRVQGPTLLVWGTSDQIVPLVYAGAFRSGLAHARVVTIAEAGHLPMLEQPERFLSAVTDFLA